MIISLLVCLKRKRYTTYRPALLTSFKVWLTIRIEQGATAKTELAWKANLIYPTVFDHVTDMRLAQEEQFVVQYCHSSVYLQLKKQSISNESEFGLQVRFTRLPTCNCWTTWSWYSSHQQLKKHNVVWILSHSLVLLKDLVPELKVWNTLSSYDSLINGIWYRKLLECSYSIVKKM